MFDEKHRASHARDWQCDLPVSCFKATALEQGQRSGPSSGWRELGPFSGERRSPPRRSVQVEASTLRQSELFNIDRQSKNNQWR